MAKDNIPSVSFFSFQDIITSITGIMFLVVIMLVLMVLQQNPVVSQKSKVLQKELDAQKKELEKIQTLIADLDRQDAVQKANIEKLKKIRVETLPGLKDEWIRKLKKIDNETIELKDLEERMLREQKELAVQKNENEILLRKNKTIYEDSGREIDDLDNEIKYQEKIYRKHKNLIRFVWKKNTHKQLVLLECSKTEIILSSLNNKVKRRSFTNMNECMSFCRSFSPDDTYFVLMLKPSSFPYGERFSRELQKAGFERGREILPSDDIVITGDIQE